MMPQANINFPTVETLTVVNGQIQLSMLPDSAGTVSIPTYTKVDSNPVNLQFSVDFPAGILQFSATANGQSLAVTYTPLIQGLTTERVSKVFTGSAGDNLIVLTPRKPPKFCTCVYVVKNSDGTTPMAATPVYAKDDIAGLSSEYAYMEGPNIKIFIGAFNLSDGVQYTAIAIVGY